MKDNELRIVWRDPKELTPYANNAKAHPVSQIDKVAASIAAFKFDQPLVVDAQGVIIKGHARREAALRLGLAKVPVIVRADLSETEAKALRLADNRVAESDWLNQELSLELEALRGHDFDLELTGFDQAELDRLLSATIDDAAAAPPDVGFKEYDESVAREVPTVTCPYCGKSFAK